MKKGSVFFPAALIVGSLAYGAGAIAGTYGGSFGNGGTAGGGGGSGDITAVGDCTSGDCLTSGTTTMAGAAVFQAQVTSTRDPSATGAANASLYINPATSASNEMFLACADNGTAVFSVDKEGDVDLRTVSNSGSGTCITGVTGVVCVTDEMGMAPASGTALFSFKTSANTSQAGVSFYDSTSTAVGGFRFFDSSLADADAANKLAAYSNGKMISMMHNTDIAAGTAAFEVRDNVGGTGVQLFTVDGSGNLFVNAAGTRTKGTITLAAGTGTATVASGSICVCSDTTATNAVRCAVATTTLTATGTGTDVIAYICL